jgi:putative nucleotidyltransferase with HDIG domain
MRTKLLDYLLPRKSPSYEQTQKYRMLYVMFVVAFLGALSTGIENLAQGWNREAMALLLLAAACLIGFFRAQTGHFTSAAALLCTLLLAGIDAALFYGAGLYDAGLIVFPIFMLSVTFLFGKKRGLFLATLASIVSVAGLYLLELMGVFDPTFPATLLRVIVLILLLTLTALVIWVVRESWESNLNHIRESYDLTLEGWARALEYRNGETAGHARRVAELSEALAQQLHFSSEQAQDIRRGALLHDIGKMAIPDSILLKPGPLTPEEWEVMKKHPTFGRDFISKIRYLHSAMDIPYSHHERWDGLGYPEGLRGEQIPLAARIFSVVDHGDALNSDRPYRKAWLREKVVAYLEENTSIVFDPHIVTTFLKLIKEDKAEIRTDPAG